MVSSALFTKIGQMLLERIGILDTRLQFNSMTVLLCLSTASMGCALIGEGMINRAH